MEPVLSSKNNAEPFQETELESVLKNMKSGTAAGRQYSPGIPDTHGPKGKDLGDFILYTSLIAGAEGS